MQVSLTVDLEPDCPPYLTGYRGIESGTPKLLALLQEQAIPVTVFSTGDVARRYPKTIEAIVAAGHELGCHGDSHRVFDTMDLRLARHEITESTETLRQFYPVISFRAPNLRFPSQFLPLLEAAGYEIDSSQAKYKLSYWRSRERAQQAAPLRRIPASATSSVLRLPKLIRRIYLSLLKEPIVLFVHPWEFVDLTKEKLRLDCRFKTGDTAIDCLRDTIIDLKKKGAEFARIRFSEKISWTMQLPSHATISRPVSFIR